ncbi:DUF3095 domain-containing protein [Starkeya sp. ORNL1]|uniref:DUF3095 domain-containing protein n=1 Tax=Starkeya sp. ORNL1 TaxID=2709380 RepID=UPI0014638F10|nr:DUF3095 domain-containing protein [Starkeya sp. ORNL1]QJP13067.1 DUF3095 domain-containing protein [Starkeya sp. ORNL1]
MTATEDFYARVPLFERFDSLMDQGHYVPLPDDWWIGITDVVASSEAIAQGRYKMVNMAGASIIAAMANALDHSPFPYAFGGDGATFAVAPAEAAPAREALAATSAFSRDEFDLPLRAALIPVAALRAQGRDVRVARFATSPQARYAMFAGGGIALAEQALKRGEFAVPAAAPGARPDLSGLSCRWQQMVARHGFILSLIVVPSGDEQGGAFHALIADILAMTGSGTDAARPIPDEGPALRWATDGIGVEASMAAPDRMPMLLRRLRIAAQWTGAALVFRLGLRLGRFDPAVYRREIAENADFRKYDDGLRMTLDGTPALADRLEARLEAAVADRVAEYGLHRQDAAIVTCFVPSVVGHDHVHFVDGATGGYAAAATRLKERRAAAS